MQKFLLIIPTIIVLTTSAHAEQNQFYGKTNIGFSKFSNQNLGIGDDKIKFKAQNTGFIGVSGGYYLMNNVRIELALDYFFNPMHKYSSITDDGDKFEAKFKSHVTSLLVNSYVDLFDINVAKIFVGAGVGMARVKTKLEFRVDNGAVPSLKSKTSNAFSYALHIGTSTEFSPNIHGELVYSYRDMGKTKKFQHDGETVPYSSIKFKAHNVAVGVRFNI